MKAKKPKTHRLRRNKAGKAVAIVRRAFADASEQNCLVELWWLLTGQRGPDDESVAGRAAKRAGTVPVRHACCPPRSEAFAKLWGESPGWEPKKVRRNEWSGMPEHWTWHIDNVVRVCHEAFGTTPSDEGGKDAGEDGKEKHHA